MSSVNIPAIPLRRIVLWTLGVSAVVGCFWLLFRFQEVVLLLLAAIIFSTAIQPGVARLEKLGVPKPIGIALIFVVVGLLLAGLLWLTIPVLAEQATAMSDSLSTGYALLRDTLWQAPNILIRRLVVVLPADLSLLTEMGSDSAVAESDLTLSEALTQSRRLLWGLFQAIALILLTFFWTLERGRIKNAAFLLVPMQHRSDMRAMVDDIEAKLSGYLLGQLLLMASIGAMALVAYMLIGLPHALLLAIFAGLMEAVPIAGPFIGAIPAIFVGLSVSPTAALWVIVATAVFQQLENNLLVPRIMNRTIGVRPLVTLLALLAFASLFGFLGALIALPLAAVIQMVLDRTLLARQSLEREEHGRDHNSVLRYETNQLVQDIRNRIRNKEAVPSAVTDELEDEVEAIALDLESYLTRREATR